MDSVPTSTLNRPCLTVSLVSFCPDLALLRQTLVSLAVAVGQARCDGVLGDVRLWVVDNGPGGEWRSLLAKLVEEIGGHMVAEIVSGHGNVGFGCGHNLVMMGAEGNYHLVLNPDVVLAQEALSEALTFMEAHPDVALLSPAATGADGHRQYLCKRYPALFDLLLRGFAPHWMKRLFRARLERYEMKAETDAQRPVDVPIASGCFMFFRLADLKRAGGFSAAYFMYFEDFDLSLRVGRMARIVHLPAVKIVHYGGHAARKGWRHVRMFARSALTFYARNGWKLL